MNTTDEITLIAPCGINCGDCPAHKAKDNSALWTQLISRGLKKELLPCPGCRPSEGACPAIDGVCPTYACVAAHEVDFCFTCPDFPCAKLNPAADRADTLPHNMKVFNLCYIQHHGPVMFLEKNPEIKQRYFQGKMSIGRGPQLNSSPDEKWRDYLDDHEERRLKTDGKD